MLLGGASIIRGNNEDVPSGDVTKVNGVVGDIHSENGGQIEGRLNGDVGDVVRANSNGTNTNLYVLGEAGQIEVPDTYVSVLNLNTVDSLGTTRSHVALDPLFGGRLSFEEQRSYFVTGAETDRTLDADTATNDDLADVLGTLIGDLRDRGIVE